MLDGKRIEKLSAIGVLTAIGGGLYLSSLYSYLLFHSLIEIITIAVAFTLFIITWNSRAYFANGYLRLLGTGYAFIALIDLAHTLAYKGMTVFPGYDANLPTQLWIAARYLQAATLLFAPLLVRRRVDDRAIFAGYAVTVAALLGLVYSGNFPDCFIDGQGLTPFKIASEYLISGLLLGALYLLYRQRAYFKDRVFALIAVSIMFTALSEMSFTAYASVYGFANLVGHFAKLAAFYLIYRAILVTGFKEPFDLIFRDLKQVESDLWKTQNSLEDKVRERTAELRESEQKYRSLIEKVQTAIVLHDGGGTVLACNPLAEELLGLSADQLRGKALIDPEWHFVTEDGSVSPVGDYPVGKVLATRQPLRGHVMGIRRPDRGHVAWVLVDAEPEFDADGKIKQIIVSFVDISQRKHAVEALHRINRELRAVSTCNQTLMHAEDEPSLLDAICRIVCHEAGYRMAWVGFAEYDAARTLRPVAWAGAGTEHLTRVPFTWADTDEGCAPSGKAIRSGESVGIADFASDPQASRWRTAAVEHGYRSCIALPLKDESGSSFGVLNIYAAEANAFTAEEQRLLGELAGDLAFGIVALRTRARRKLAEAAEHRLNRELHAISKCNQTLMHATDEPTLLDDICRIVCEEAGYRMAWVGFAEHDAGKTLRPVAWAGEEGGYLEQARLTWAATDYGRGPSGTAIRTGEMAAIGDFRSDPVAAPWRAAAEQRGYRSSIALPLKDESANTFGVLNIYSGEPHAFTVEEKRLLQELAGDLAFGISVLRARIRRQRVERIFQGRLRLLEFATSHSMDELLTATLDKIEMLTGSAIAFYHFVEADQITLSLQSWSTNTLQKMCTAAGRGSHYDIDKAGVWVDCVNERRPVIHNDYASLPHRRGMPEGHAPVVREMVVPIFRGEQIKAIIGVGNKATDYNENDIEIAAQLGDLSWDIVERKRAEEAQHRLNRELRAISNCNQTLMRADNEPALLHDICHIVCEEAGYRMAWVGFAEDDEAKTLRPVAWAGAETGYIELARLTWADTEHGRRPSGIAVRSGEPAGIADYESETTTAPWRAAAIEHGYRSSISLPLKDDNARTFGVLNIYSDQPNAFTPEERRLLEELAGDLAFGITVLRARIERNQALELIEKRIFALTRPLEDGSVSFDDLFDRAEIQRIQDEFALATGVASLITKPDGTPLTAPSNFTPLCSEIIRKTERGALNCTRSDAAIGSYHPEGPIVQPCLSGGLWDAGASITVGGHHVANWLIGQVRDETQTEEKMRAYAREIGADEAAYMAAFQQVPAMSRQRFERVARALFTLANQLSASAYQNIQQARFITERRVAEKEIEHLAFYDLLTQLPNRRLLMDRLQQAMADSGRNRHRGALLFIDLDNFKIINDTCGHDVGDQLLIDVADRLTTCVRDGDTVSRLGGDEFVVMLKDLGENPQEAAAQTKGVSEKILMTLNQPFTIGGHVHHSTASIGVTLFLDSENPMDDLLKQADIAMYQAKAAGRNTLRFFDPEMQAALAARADLETSLRRAIQEQQFVLHFQPQVDDLRGIVGAEALVRWQQPGQGMVSPAHFIPLAEDTGLILAIGQWVLEDACARLRAWADDPLTRDLHLAVNVSARQFRQADFVTQVRQVLLSTGAPASRLKLELTESLVLDNVKDTIEKMQALKLLGVGFSMDDFGTGYSSLSYLSRLPLDQLKIDQSFVRNLPDNANDAVVAQTIITLAQSLGLGVIAEGVETEAQRQFLSEHGCPVFQGYLFSKPLPLDAFRKLLAGG